MDRVEREGRGCAGARVGARTVTRSTGGCEYCIWVPQVQSMAVSSRRCFCCLSCLALWSGERERGKGWEGKGGWVSESLPSEEAQSPALLYAHTTTLLHLLSSWCVCMRWVWCDALLCLSLLLWLIMKGGWREECRCDANAIHRSIHPHPHPAPSAKRSGFPASHEQAGSGPSRAAKGVAGESTGRAQYSTPQDLLHT